MNLNSFTTLHSRRQVVSCHIWRRNYERTNVCMLCTKGIDNSIKRLKKKHKLVFFLFTHQKISRSVFYFRFLRSFYSSSRGAESDAAIGRWSSLPLLIRLFCSMVICRTVLQNAPGDDGGLTRGRSTISNSICGLASMPAGSSSIPDASGGAYIGNFQIGPFRSFQVALDAGVGPHLPRGCQLSEADVPAAKGSNFIAQPVHQTTTTTTMMTTTRIAIILIGVTRKPKY